MDLSRKTDYALRMLAALVKDPSGVVSVRTAAREGGVPYSFARSIQHDLGVAGIVENSRGATGGMRLAVDPREVTLLDLIEAVQGPVVISGCLGPDGASPCPNASTCHFATIWRTAENLLRAYFASVSLHQVVVDGMVPIFDGDLRLVDESEARERCAREGAAVGCPLCAGGEKGTGPCAAAAVGPAAAAAPAGPATA